MLRMERMAQNGQAIAHDEQGRVVFVQGGLPGELATVKLMQSKKRFARGVVKKVLEPSELRVEPPCPVGHLCGGCDLQHVDFESQGEIKTRVILESMARLSKLDLSVDAWFEAPSLSDWRVRATIRAHRMSSGSLKLGMLERGSHRVVDVDRCMVLVEPMQRAMLRLRELCELLEVQQAEFFLELADTSGGVVVTVQRFEATRKRESAAAIAALVDGEGIVGVCVHKSLNDLDLIEGGVTGDCHVMASVALADCPASIASYTLPPRMFRQAHRDLAPVLVERAMRAILASESARRAGLAAPTHSLCVTEFFSGCGNFTFAMARALAASSPRIVAMEGEREAVEIARDLVSQAGLTETIEVLDHVDLFSSEGLERVFSHERVDAPGGVIFLDPPRAGARELCEVLAGASCRASSIVYVACDAMTLARDLEVLCGGGWRVERLEMVDMFPGTSHVESVVRLER